MVRVRSRSSKPRMGLDQLCCQSSGVMIVRKVRNVQNLTIVMVKILM